MSPCVCVCVCVLALVPLGVLADTVYIPIAMGGLAGSRPTATPTLPVTASATSTSVPPTATPTLPVATATPTPIPPTATQTATPTLIPPTATLTPTATATTIPSTPTATTIPPTPTATPHWEQLVRDGGFELGPSSFWAEYSSGGFELIVPGIGYNASWGAFLGGYPSSHDAIGQYIGQIPPDTIYVGSVMLAYMMITEELPYTAHDYLRIWLTDASANHLLLLGSMDNRGPANIWMAFQSPDLTSYRGQTVGLTIECDNDGIVPTHFDVDGVSFAVQVP